MRGWGRSGGFCRVNKGADIEEGFLSGELDACARVSLLVLPLGLLGMGEKSGDIDAGSAFFIDGISGSLMLMLNDGLGGCAD